MNVLPSSILLNVFALPIQYSLAAVCIMAAVGKLLGYDSSLSVLETVGLDAFQSAIIGLIQVAAGLMLIIPHMARYGAILLAALMISANRLFMFSLQEPAPALSIIILIMCFSVALIRWDARAERFLAEDQRLS
ncbi:MAG: DoxX family protein [Pseudomonadota bacterium]